jgi:predicted AAA+ superfamily ATPase
MKKDLIKKMLLEFEEDELPETFERELRLPEELFNGKIRKATIITGPRRAGKTYYLYGLAKKLKGKSILYFNFEDERVVEPTAEDLTLILESYNELHPDAKLHEMYIFLDEIENVDKWEKFVRRTLDARARVFITGSNSKLLGKEISTAMRGRSVTFRLDPLSFKEFLKIKGIEEETKNIIYGKIRFKAKRLLEEYLKWGGYPEISVVEDDRLKRSILQEYLLTMMHKDVEERYKVDNLPALENLIKYLVTNISTTISFNKIEDWMNSIGINVSRTTLIEYSKYLERAFAFSFVGKFDYSLKKQIRSLPKVYANDVGLHTANSFKFKTDIGRIAENIVYNHLVNGGKEIYYDTNGYECDFVLKEGLKVKEAIQVCWKLDEENKKREVIGLVSAMKKFKLKKGKVVNWDHKASEEIEGLKIEYVPLMEFLIS